jgi:superfamily II DNA or RNA helicase
MLREYQQRAVDQIREAITQGHRDILLHVPTGGGKTVIFSYILKHSRFNACMVVKGRQLVDQASNRLRREETDHGVLMAGHWNFKPSAKVQICSIDTITSRDSRLDVKIIIIDEAHMALSPSYTKFLSQFGPDVVKIWVTATPYNKEGLPCTVVVHPISFKELVAQGFLVPPRYYIWEGPSVKDVKTQGGDFNQVQLAKAVDKGDLIGDIVEHWRFYGEQRPTLCFAVNVAHSKHIVARFNEAGIPAAHVDADTPEVERAEQLQKHKEGGIAVICNVNIHSTGVDIPWLGCIIEARPTKSYNLYVQQLGRGTRCYSDRFSVKEDFIVLDTAGNFFRHGNVEDEPEALLARDVAAGKKLEKVSVSRYCNKHFMAFVGHCPKCRLEGVENVGTEIKLEKEGRLRELKELSPEEEYLIGLRREMALSRKADGSKYKRGWLWYRMKDKFSEEVANKWVPRRVVPDFIRRRLAQ